MPTCSYTFRKHVYDAAKGAQELDPLLPWQQHVTHPDTPATEPDRIFGLPCNSIMMGIHGGFQSFSLSSANGKQQQGARVGCCLAEGGRE